MRSQTIVGIILSGLLCTVIIFVCSTKPSGTPAPTATYKAVSEGVWQFEVPAGDREVENFNEALKRFETEHRDCEIVCLAKDIVVDGKLHWKVVVRKK